MFSYIYVYDTYHVSEKNVIFIHSYYCYYSNFTVIHCKCANFSYEYIYNMNDISSKSPIHSWCFHIYIWYISYHSKNILYSLYVVNYFYSITVLLSFTASVLSSHIYILYEWYILWITNNCSMFSYVYMTYIMSVENIMYSTKLVSWFCLSYNLSLNIYQLRSSDGKRITNLAGYFR